MFNFWTRLEEVPFFQENKKTKIYKILSHCTTKVVKIWLREIIWHSNMQLLATQPDPLITNKTAAHLQSYWPDFRSCSPYFAPVVQEGADKSFAWLGRKQAAAIKLGIYSTYSPRSSKHLLARCPNLCKPLKKTISKLSVQPGIRGSADLRVGRKMAKFQFFFFSSGNRW